ncbi:MAG: PP2C family protein-serine/threonine phosphatase [Calditrichaceae bacterium]|nr:PP2C family protein-serine/threonine phosphatase [Calditrichaceae bacterium]
MSHHLESFKERNLTKIQTEELDRRHIELLALFEISQSLSSSLNLKSILDTILLVPMGRMMISRGLVLLQDEAYEYKIKNIKGLPYSILEKQIHISSYPDHPIFISKTEKSEDWISFLSDYHIELLLPLISKHNQRGFIGYGSKLSKQPYSDEEIEFLSSLSNIAVQSIENAIVFEELNSVNRELDKKIQELNTLFEIGKEFNHIFEQEGILKQLSYSLMGQMLINQFFIALKTDDTLKIVYKKGSLFTTEKLNKCMAFCNQIADILQPVILNENNQYEQLYRMGVRAIIPMNIQNENGGYIFLGDKLDKSEINNNNLDFLTTLGNMTMISIENARLFKETLEKQTLEEELNLAKNIQQRLLPSKMPDIANFDIHGFNLASKQVGGDYFDVIRLNKHTYILTIADVSGKGMPASLLMSNLQAGLKTLSFENNTLAEITLKLNNLIHSNTSIEKYITFFILKINTSNGKIEYVNAGHNPPLLIAADNSCRKLEKGGIILGMMKDVSFETGYDTLSRGECITMFTDGVTEAMDENNTEFGEESVIKYFQNHFRNQSCEQLNYGLLEQLKSFCGDPTKSDDVTILTIKSVDE